MNVPKRILRPQFNGRNGTWVIVEKTNNGSGGWKRFQPIPFKTKPEAVAWIDHWVETWKGEFEKEV